MPTTLPSQPRGSRFLINGEPTENKLALGTKGALRYEVSATGKMAHSAYPELGDSAIHKLIDALAEMRRMPLPTDPLLGPSTLNIGTIHGGVAPNVIADVASAEILVRLVGDSTETKQAIARAVEGRAELLEVIGDSRASPGVTRWPGNHRSGVYHRHPGIRRPMGRAVSPGARHHSCGPHSGGASSQETINGSSRNLSKHGQAVMQTRIEVGILGATGMVGQHFIKFLQGHPWFDLKWLGASDRSAGKKYKDAMTWHLNAATPEVVCDLTVEDCKPGNAPRLLFSAMDASVATEIEQAFAQAGHVVVSNSRNHRMERDVPLLVPEINPDHLKLVPGQQRARGWKGQIVTKRYIITRDGSTSVTSSFPHLRHWMGLEERLMRNVSSTLVVRSSTVTSC